MLGAGSWQMSEGAGAQIRYSTGAWDANKLGNHRAVIQVKDQADAVRVLLPWRRCDKNPENKNIIIIDAQTDRRIHNLFRAEINRAYGDIVFQPETTPGRYYVYYLPFVSTGRNYPQVTYTEPEQSAQPSWLQQHGLSSDQASKLNVLPTASIIEFQAIDEFNSFYPMEIIAAAEEVAQLKELSPQFLYLLFPEDRIYPIRMSDDLPFRWVQKPPPDSFHGTALRGEFYTFQIGVYASTRTIDGINVHFSALKHKDGQSLIPAMALRCFNTAGTDWTGRQFTKTCSVKKGKVQALWLGVQIPQDATPGDYTGEIEVTAKDLETQKVLLRLDVKPEMLTDAGDREPWRHSRLRWLDSTIALDDEVVAPFTPLKLEGSTISCLGRSVTIGKNGFPEKIQSCFAPEVTHITDLSRQVLSAPIRLAVENPDHEIVPWQTTPTQITRQTPGAISWESQNTAGDITINCTGRIEFDGFLEYKIKLTAARDTAVNDIRLEIPIARDVARYLMGMGLKGGLRPRQYQWQWDPKKNHDALWIGDVNAGLQCSLRDENYSRPLNTNFYLRKPLVMPRSWYNNGQGGCSFTETDANTFLVRPYSGPRIIKAGEVLYYNFNLLITPFKPLDTAGQWNTRYYHAYKPVDEIAAGGANTINIHHATPINPYINYPFLHPRELKEYIDQAHEKGLKVKIYYTVRELSNHAPELFALLSLGDEILIDGPAGGFSWLQEHLGSNYIAGWFVADYQDAALINSGVSRWHNYYLEGLNWLVRNVGIDGLYLDDVAFDRTVMKRARKILDRNRPGALIDLHSANQYNQQDGFVNSANLYLEHFPYINRLWFGEYFDYDSSPDYWLIEVSGIPFGLMGEMLQDGGNPWRGMLYGMTARLPRRQMPRRLWKLWDQFGIADARMLGYWSPNCPVKTDHEKVLATCYVKMDKVLIALASWAQEPVKCRLKIDWDALKINPKQARLEADFIEDFQEKAHFSPTHAIPVEPGKGWLLLLSER